MQPPAQPELRGGTAESLRALGDRNQLALRLELGGVRRPSKIIKNH